jgi:hypothetical protein
MASRARLEGICEYRLWTTEELIEAYAWEAGRINQEDRRRTQRLIKQELKRRFDATLRLLDDEQTTQNPKGTYRYLLND